MLCVELVDQRLEFGFRRHDPQRLDEFGSLAEQTPCRTMPAGETGRAVWPTIIMIIGIIGAAAV